MLVCPSIETVFANDHKCPPHRKDFSVNGEASDNDPGNQYRVEQWSGKGLHISEVKC